MNKKTFAVMSFISLCLLGCEVEESPQRPSRESPPNESVPTSDPMYPQGERQDVLENDRTPVEPLDDRAEDAIRQFEEETKDIMNQR